MTKTEFLNGFYLGYDQISDLALPGYTPLELSVIASKVQEDLVVTKYGNKGNKLQEGFEETEKRIQDLGELVRYKTYTGFTLGFFTDSVYITLPNTLITNSPTDFSDVYWFTIYEEAISDKLDCSIKDNTTKYIKLQIEDILHGELDVSLYIDPFRKPYLKGNIGKILRVRSEGRKYTLITDGSFNVSKYSIGYIKKPKPIDLTTTLTNPVSELSDHVQRELLQMTINFCLKAVGDKDKLGLELSFPTE